MTKTRNFIDVILAHKARFVLTFVFLFAVFYGILYAIDFYPEAPEPIESEDTDISTELELDPSNTARDTEDSAQEPSTAIDDTPELADTTDPTDNAVASSIPRSELPLVISFPTLDKVVPVLNPRSSAVDDLDHALLSGAVRHPESATFTQNGTIFILAHSSYLPNVLNKNYQAFNGIQNLSWGDTIELESEDGEYTYRVDKVYKAKAADVTVPIANTGKKLVLATCNSFASKDDRYVVEASLIETKTL